MQRTVQQLALEISGREFAPDAPLADAGMDSLEAVELRQMLSDAFNLELPATLMYDYESVAAIAGYIADLSGAGAGGGAYPPEREARPAPPAPPAAAAMQAKKKKKKKERRRKGKGPAPAVTPPVPAPQEAYWAGERGRGGQVIEDGTYGGRQKYVAKMDAFYVPKERFKREQRPLAASAAAAPLGPPGGRQRGEPRSPARPRGADPARAVEATVQQLALEISGREFAPDAPLADAGMDSLEAVELRQMLSDAFNLELPATLMYDYESVAAIAGYIADLSGAGAYPPERKARPAAPARRPAPRPAAAAAADASRSPSLMSLSSLSLSEPGSGAEASMGRASSSSSQRSRASEMSTSSYEHVAAPPRAAPRRNRTFDSRPTSQAEADAKLDALVAAWGGDGRHRRRPSDASSDEAFGRPSPSASPPPPDRRGSPRPPGALLPRGIAAAPTPKAARRRDSGGGRLHAPPGPPVATEGTYDQARTLASVTGKWLLVYLQSGSEEATQRLNRETFSSLEVRDVIRANFVFWVGSSWDDEGSRCCTMVGLEQLPAIFLLNPFSGKRRRVHYGFLAAEGLAALLLEWCSTPPFDGVHGRRAADEEGGSLYSGGGGSQRSLGGHSRSSSRGSLHSRRGSLSSHPLSRPSSSESLVLGPEESNQHLDELLDRATSHVVRSRTGSGEWTTRMVPPDALPPPMESLRLAFGAEVSEPNRLPRSASQEALRRRAAAARAAAPFLIHLRVDGNVRQVEFPGGTCVAELYDYCFEHLPGAQGRPFALKHVSRQVLELYEDDQTPLQALGLEDKIVVLGWLD